MISALGTGVDISITFTETLIKGDPEVVGSFNLNGQNGVKIELKQVETDVYNIILTGKVRNLFELKKEIQEIAANSR